MTKETHTVELNRKNKTIKLMAEGKIQVEKPKRMPGQKGSRRFIDSSYLKNKKKREELRLCGIKHGKRVLVVAACMLLIAVVYSIALSVVPYAIVMDEDEVCTVRGKAKAEKTVEKAIEHYIPEGATLKAIDADCEIRIEKSDSIFQGMFDAVSVSDAVELIVEKQEEENHTITTLSAKTKIEDYVPTPNYVKDETMLAGEEEIVEDGETGKQKTIVRYRSVNGDVKEKEVVGNIVLEEGSPATVKKGTLGLPEGEDWRTYTGDPIYKDGEELSQTALKYLGAPYKYGGTSLKYGIDCVQFIRQMYAKYGISLPNGKNALKHVGTKVSGGMKAGDIICYSNHYALYIGDGKIVEAVKKGVRVYNNPSYRKIVTVRRVVQ